MGAERDAVVVGDVQPLVCVRRPRVGPLDARGEATERRRGRGPEAEGTVDVVPGAMLLREVGDRRDVVAGARVHLAELRADDRRAGGPAELVAQLVDSDPALVVDRDRPHAAGPEPDEAERTVERPVALRAGENGDRRAAGQAVLLDVVPG